MAQDASRDNSRAGVPAPVWPCSLPPPILPWRDSPLRTDSTRTVTDSIISSEVAPPRDALLTAQLEVRDLQAGISALRDQLEAQEHAAAERAEKARADADAEIRDLQATVVRLRRELEDAVGLTRERVLAETGEYRDTLEQHVGTIRALREQLERIAASDRNSG